MPKVTDAFIDYKKKQARWLRTISLSHSLYCNCTDYVKHLQKIWRGVEAIACGQTTKNHTGGEEDGRLGDQLIINGGGEGFPTTSLHSEESTG